MARDSLVHFITVGTFIYGAFGLLKGELTERSGRTRILYREAIAMGLDRNDQVIELRLAQKLEFLSRGLVSPGPPSKEVLAAWYAENGERSREPDTYIISQLFFDLDRRDDAVGNALSALAQLRLTESMPEGLTRYGDNSILWRDYASGDEIELRKLFGSAFVEQVLLLQFSGYFMGVAPLL